MLKRTLRPIDALSADEPRGVARTLLNGVAASKGSPAMSLTVRTFGLVFLANCAPRWKFAALVPHSRSLRTWMLSVFRSWRIDAITDRDVRAWFDELSLRGVGTVDRTLAMRRSANLEGYVATIRRLARGNRKLEMR